MKEKLLNQDEIIKREFELYKKSLNDFGINSDKEIYNRSTTTFIEYDFNMPQTIFYIIRGGDIIFGRKTLSHLYLAGKLKSINCSNIKYNMLFGVLKSANYNNRKIEIEYYPFTNKEKKQQFNKIVDDIKNYEIYFPFRFKYYDTNLEQTSSNLDWKIDDRIANYLSVGEKHIRKYTIKIIKNYHLNPKIVYDPACSTGEFLKTIKDVVPHCKTIGHDMSKEMVDFSKKNVDESKCCDAFASPINDNSVDLLVLRFLNGGVVDSDNAKKLFELLVKKVKSKGYIICIGHTPILINSKMFEALNLELLEKIGHDESVNSIFQYYFAKKR